MVADFAPQPQQEPSISRHGSQREQQRSLPVKTIGNYSLQQSIGKGSMGKVKLGVHNVTGEKVRVDGSIV
jgi:serine/threonine protein kinase